jgi:hypothetical protein
MSGEWVVKQEKVAVGSQAACPRLGRFRRPVDNGGSKEQGKEHRWPIQSRSFEFGATCMYTQS